MMQSPNINSSIQRFTCESTTCGHSSSSHSNLLRHYRENLSHKPDNLQPQGRPRETADEVISACFNDNLAPRSRSARAKAFVAKLSDEELKKYCLHRLSKFVKPWEFLLESAKTSNGLHVSKIAHCFPRCFDTQVP
jgi:hypothetical protein